MDWISAGSGGSDEAGGATGSSGVPLWSFGSAAGAFLAGAGGESLAALTAAREESAPGVDLALPVSLADLGSELESTKIK